MLCGSIHITHIPIIIRSCWIKLLLLLYFHTHTVKKVSVLEEGITELSNHEVQSESDTGTTVLSENNKDNAEEMEETEKQGIHLGYFIVHLDYFIVY